MSRSDFKIGDRVLALLTWGIVVGYCEKDAERLKVLLDTNRLETFHWAECRHERNVVVLP